ncbi:MAG: sugar phosphate isomerase/epimerase family protein [Candidatus Syntropharchaeia archaeon]
MKFGFSSLALTDDPFQWAYRLEDIGFSGWEIVDEGRYRIENIKREIEEVCESTNLIISVHAPFSDLNLASVNQPIWEETIRQMSACVENSGDFADICVVHPGILSPLGAQIPEKAWEQMIFGLRKLCDIAEEYGMMIGVENMINLEPLLGRFPDELLGIVETVDRDNIGIVFDVGHANTMNVIDEFLEVDVVHVHVHDNFGEKDEHLPPGHGNIEWKKVMDGLKRYNGRIVIEARNLDEGEEGLKYLLKWI